MRLVWLPLAIALCSAACDDDSGAADLAVDLAAPGDLMVGDLAVEMPAVSATGRVNPDVVVSGFVDVVATHAATVVVDYGATTTYGLRTRVVPVPACGMLTLPVLGLAPSATNHLRV